MDIAWSILKLSAIIVIFGGLSLLVACLFGEVARRFGGGND